MSRTQKGLLGWNLVMGRTASKRAAAFILSLSAVSGTYAGITGQNVVQGTATFIPTANGWKIVASNGAIINYNYFGVSSGEAIKFIQPGANSRVLNRVLGDFPTRIDGSLTSNGILYIVNPAGVFIGPTGVVNVGGLYAAAGKMSNEDFNAGAIGGATPGSSRFTGLSGKVSNKGIINAATEAHLVGASVVNSGSISVGEGGYLTMVASTGTVRIMKNGIDPQVFVDVQISPAAGGNPGSTIGVNNTGTVKTGSGGQILMGAGDIYALAIRNSSSSTVSAPDGTVTYKGAVVQQSGALTAGKLDVQAGEFQVGGTVKADHVDVSGDVSLLRDTTFTGQSGQATSVTFNGATSSAASPQDLTIDSHTFVAEGSLGTQDAKLGDVTITGDATFGSDVIATGDVLVGGTTTFDGADQVATTDGNLTFSGDVSKSTAGSLSLFGENISFGANVDQAGGDLVVTAGGTADSQGGGTISIFGNLGASGSAVLEAAQINFTGLGAQSAEAGSNLTFNGDLSKATGDLTLTAGQVLGLNGDVHVLSGSLNASAGERISVAGDVEASQAVALAAPDISFEGAGDQLVSAGTSLELDGEIAKATAGALSLDAGTTLDIDGSVSVDAGDFAATSGDGLSITGDVSASGAVDIATGGELGLGGNVSAGTNVGLSGTSISFFGPGAQTIGASGSIELTGDATKDAGDLSLTAGSTLTLNDTVETTGGSLTAIASGLLTIGENIAAGGFVSLTGNGIEFSSAGDQTVDAGTDIALDGDVSKASGLLGLNAGGDLSIDGTMQLGGDLDAAAGGTLSITSDLQTDGDLSLAGTEVRFTSVNDQSLTVGGNLTVVGDVSKETGSLELGVGQTLSLDGSVAVDAGDFAATSVVGLSITGDVTASGAVGLAAGGELGLGGNVSAGTDVGLSGASISFFGPEAQTIGAGGSIELTGDATKGSGDLSLTAGSTLTLNDTVETTGGSLTAIASGLLTIGENIAAGGFVSLTGNGIEFSSAGDQSVEAGTDIALEGDVSKTSGLLGLNADGDLLIGGTMQLGGDLDATAGGTLSIASDMKAGGDASLAGSEIRFTSLNDQTLSIGGDLTLSGATTKETGALDLEVGQTLNLDGDVTVGGDLSAMAGMSLLVGGDIEVGGSALLDSDSIQFTDDAAQSVTAGSSLTIDGNASKAAGSLALSTTAVDGVLTLTGDEIVVSAGSATFTSASIEFVSDVAQLVDVTGDLALLGDVSKATGDLELKASGALLADGNVDATTGSLSMSAGGDLTLHGDAHAGVDLSLGAGVAGDGLGGATIILASDLDQSIDAGGNVNILGSVLKNSGNVNVQAGLDLTATGAMTVLDGDIDLNAAGGTLSLGGDLNATGNVDLTGADIEFTGTDSQSVGAGGNLALHGDTTKATNSLALNAGDAFTMDGLLSVTEGDLIVNADLEASFNNDVEAGGSIAVSAAGIVFDGATAQSVTAGIDPATTGDLLLDGPVTKGDGDLGLFADGNVELTDSVSAMTGALTIEAGQTVTLLGNAFADGVLSVSGTEIHLDGEGDQSIESGSDLLIDGELTKSGGDLDLLAANTMTLDGDITVTDGGLDAAAGIALTILGDISTSGSTSLQADSIEFTGTGAQSVTAGGELQLTGETSKINGNLDLSAIGDVTLNDKLSGDADLSVSSTSGSILVDDNIASAGSTTLSATSIQFTDGGAQSITAGDDLSLIIVGNANGAIQKAGGDLTLTAQNNLALLGLVELGLDQAGGETSEIAAGNLVATATDGDLTIGSDIIVNNGSATLDGNAIKFTRTVGTGAQKVVASENISLTGDVSKSKGDLLLDAQQELSSIGSITLSGAQAGSLTLDADVIDVSGLVTAVGVTAGQTTTTSTTLGGGVLATGAIDVYGNVIDVTGDVSGKSVKMFGDDIGVNGAITGVDGILLAGAPGTNPALASSIQLVGDLTATNGTVELHGNLIDVTGDVSGKSVEMFGGNIGVDGAISGVNGILLAGAPGANPALAASVQLGGDLTSTSGDVQLLAQTVELTGDATWTANNIDVAGDITGQGQSLTINPNSATGRVDLAGDVGEAGSSLANFTLEQGLLSFNSVAAEVHAQEVHLHQNGQVVVPGLDVPGAHVGGLGDLTFDTSVFEMDEGLILSTVGTLKISAATSATLGELNTGGDMIVDSDDIRLQAGADFVSLGVFDFSTTPVAANGSGERFEFASSSDDSDLRGTLANEPAIRLRLLPQSGAGAYTSESLKAILGESLWFLDLSPAGPTTASAATTLAAVAPQDLEAQRESDTVSLNPEDREALARILGSAIELRDPSVLELIQLATGYVTFIDTPLAGSPVGGNRIRLPSAVIRMGSPSAIQRLVDADAEFERLSNSELEALAGVVNKLERAYQARTSNPSSLEEAATELMDHGSDAERSALRVIVEYTVGGESLGLTRAEQARVNNGWPQSYVRSRTGEAFTVPASAFDANFRRVVNRGLARK